MAATFETTFEVNASAEQVWSVITDFARYPEWNPQITSASGDLAVGSTIKMTLALPGRPSLKVKAKLAEVAPGESLVWDGKIAADRFFHGHREFRIKPGDNGAVLVTHVERLTGAFVPVFLVMMRKAVNEGHHALNLAITKRSENS